MTTATNMKDKKKSKHIPKIYDTIIVGGGIGGLYTAHKLQQKHNAKTKTHDILLLEANDRLGGRIHSITKNDIVYEAGAARFHDKQHKIMNLIREFNLEDKLIKLSNEVKFISTPRDKYLNCKYLNYVIHVDELINDISDLVEAGKIKEQELIDNSLINIMNKHFDKKYPNIATVFEETYEYWSEIAIMNAKDALNLFKNDLNSKNTYYSLHGGLTQLIEKLEMNLKINIETNYLVKSINKNTDNTFTINNKYTCRNLVLALPKHNLLELDYLAKKPDIKTMLNSVVETPLCRIYAKYSKTILNYQSWFYRLPKTTLPGSKLKYFIPINYPYGLVMISYTDGKYAKYWKPILDDKRINLKKKICDEASKTFPDIEEMPLPEWVSHHYWDHGAGYWKVGADSDKILSSIIKPIDDDNIFICGENYSRHQAWIEGALDSANKVVNIIK